MLFADNTNIFLHNKNATDLYSNPNANLRELSEWFTQLYCQQNQL